MQPRRRHSLLLPAVISMLACALVAYPGPPAGADGSAQALIAGVETTPFLEAIGAPHPMEYGLGPCGASYKFPRPPTGGAIQVSIGVHPSAQMAVDKYRDLVAEAVGAPQPDLPGDIGDQFGYWPDGDAAGTLLLRRRNALFSANWQGSQDAAVAFARKVDGVLAQSDEICPKAAVVPVPEVELIAPALAGLGSVVPIRYTSRMAMLVRTESAPGLRTEGSLQFQAKELGEHALEFVFASSRNVVFTASLTIQVVPPEQLASPEALQPWEWPDGEIYFLRDPEQAWSAIPADQQERMRLHRGTFSTLENAADWQQKGLNELMAVVQGRWLPTIEMVHAYQDDAHPSQDKIYYAAFRTQGCGLVYLGSVAKGFLLYIEQPDPLPEGTEQLAAADVLRAEVLPTRLNEEAAVTDPGVGFVVRTFHRHRAYQPDGPYEPVRILLASVRFPAELNLRFPGYR